MKDLVKIGDIVRVEDIHHTKQYYYEVDEVHSNSIISQPAQFRHRFDDITAIYRLIGKDFKCIWEKKYDKL